MRVKKRHFPFPVLSPFSDDIEGEMTADIKAEEILGTFEFAVDFQLNNQTLQELIDVGEAVFAVHLECGSTMKRFFEKSNKASFRFKIDQKLLNNTVEINFFIVAERDIENYINEGFHEDFWDAAFSIQKGDQLAFAHTVKMNITKEPIADTNSIFEISINHEKDAALFKVEFADKIIIQIPKNNYEQITNMRGYIGTHVDQLFIAMYYTPALIETLYYIKDLLDSDEEHNGDEDSIWYRSIEKRLATLNIQLEHLAEGGCNIPELAMKILDDVNGKALDAINKIYGYPVEEVYDDE